MCSDGPALIFVLPLSLIPTSLIPIWPYPCRFVDDSLSDALLENNIPMGSTLSMDIQPDTGDISVTHSLENITVAGHASLASMGR